MARQAHGRAGAQPGDDKAGGGGSAASVDETGGVREHLDALVERVKGLRKRTAEAALFLTVYDLRRAQEVWLRDKRVLRPAHGVLCES